MPRAKQRTPELRERVLSAAIELLASDGPAALTARAVARAAGTSTPAVYELFGDKGGLVRAVFFAGFGRLHERLEALPASDDPRADALATARAYRAFVVANPALAEVMLSRPFTDFAPGPDDLSAQRLGADADRRPLPARDRRRPDRAATRPTSRTPSSRCCRASPPPRPPIASARRRPRSTAAGSWRSTRCSTGSRRLR